MKTLFAIAVAMICSTTIMASTEEPVNMKQEVNATVRHHGPHSARVARPRPQNFGGGPMMMDPASRVANLDKTLKLSDEQKTQLTELYTKQDEDMKARMEAMAGKPFEFTDEMRAQFEADRKAQIEAHKKILTEEQFQKYEEMQKNSPFGQGFGPRP